MAVFKTKWFARWARKCELDDASILTAIEEMMNGQYEADLGGKLYKKRIAKSAQGKSSGFRTLIASNMGDRWFLVFGFEKNQRANIDAAEERALKHLAKNLLSTTEQEINKAIKCGELIEVKDGKES